MTNTLYFFSSTEYSVDQQHHKKSSIIRLYIYMKIQTRHLILLALIVPLITSIYLPLTPKRPRCMMVYTIGDIETVKIFLDLPQLPSQGREELYLFTMRNTESQEIKTQNIQNGKFNREYELIPNVIYEVCIQLNTDRPLDNIVIYYKAQTIYNIEHSQLKIPENLLKKQDFRGTYKAAYHIEETVKEYEILQKDRTTYTNQNFGEINGVDKKLVVISVIEIIIVVAAGIYQYYSLQNYLTTKQYI